MKEMKETAKVSENKSISQKKNLIGIFKYSQFALLAPLRVLVGLLLDRGLVLLLAQPDCDEGVVGAVLPLDVQALGLLD